VNSVLLFIYLFILAKYKKFFAKFSRETNFFPNFILPISFSKNGEEKKTLRVPASVPFVLALRGEDVSLRRAFVSLSPSSSLMLLSLGVLANALASLAIVSQSIRFQEKEVDKVETPQQMPCCRCNPSLFSVFVVFFFC
jgi:hypothetical protein